MTSTSTIGASLCVVAFDMSSAYLADVVESAALLKVNIGFRYLKIDDQPKCMVQKSFY